MKILVVNCGSSSLKYQLIDMENEQLLAKGLCDRITLDGSYIEQTVNGEKTRVDKKLENHKDAIELVVETLTNKDYGAIADMSEISAVGHRVVHGGEDFASSVVITEKVMQSIRDCIPLAPLHNPPNIIGIEACQEIMPNVPMVAVFDTAFHQTLPEKAYMYAIPHKYYDKYKIRKYGFHGTSHKYVSSKAAEVIGKPIEDLKIITCHLGNGSSISAVDCGKSVETSMGFTPLAGLAMGTRCGNIDPAVVTFLQENENLDIKQTNTVLNKESGVLGVSEVSSDFRDLDAAKAKGNEKAALALDMFGYQVKLWVGQCAAAMGGVDAIVFTGGIGENTPHIRAKAVEGLEYMGVELDEKANDGRFGTETKISKASSKVDVWVIPTNEELAIARETKALTAK